MISDRQLPEIPAYHDEEHSLPLLHEPNLASKVIFGNNDTEPVHGWFRFKEGFSAGLLPELLTRMEPELGSDFRMLDPFCGAGTTLLSAQELSAKGFQIAATGIERNPFISFVARTKVQWRKICTTELLERGAEALHRSTEVRVALPELSSIKEGRCISVHNAERILSILESIDRNDVTADSLRLGVASSIELLSRVRKDGRALRIVDKPRRSVARAIKQKWEGIKSDCETLAKRSMGSEAATIICGDGRNPLQYGFGKSSFDLIFTSPPYPNNIDYTEVYKLELWLMQFVKTSQGFLDLRHSTFSSHPTYKKDAVIPEDFVRELQKGGALNRVLGVLLDRMSQSPEAWRARLLTAYFADMWISISNFYSLLRKGGSAVLVVGNSLHGTSDIAFLVPTDLVLARIAEFHGFTVQSISIARGLKRRLSGNHFLRESVLVLKK